MGIWKRKWVRVLVTLAVLLMLSGAALAALATYWIMPAVFKNRFVQNLGERIDGQVTLDAVDFFWTEPITLHGLRITDAHDRLWLTAESIRLEHDSMYTLRFRATGGEIRGLHIQAHVDSDGIHPPLKPSSGEPPAGGAGDSNEMDLRWMTVEQSSFSLVASDSERMMYDNLHLEVRRWGENYDFSLIGECDGAAVLHLNGRAYGPTLEGGMSLSWQQTLRSDQDAVLLRAVFPGADLDAGGTIHAELMAEGPLTDWAALRITGQATVKDWSVRYNSTEMCREMQARIDLTPDNLQMKMPEAKVLGGSATGECMILLERNQPKEYSGQFDVSDLSVTLLRQMTDPGVPGHRGRLSAKGTFVWGAEDLSSLRAAGMFVLRDANLMPMPIISAIFRRIAPGDDAGLNQSEAAGVLSLQWPVVTVAEGHVSNVLSAVEVEPGGTVNLQSHQLDMYVVGVPFKEMRGILGNVPVFNLFLSLKDKLTRLYIKGNWDDPPARLITKRPVTDVREGTVDFFAGAAREGGKLGSDLIQGVGKTFEAIGRELVKPRGKKTK